MSDRFTEDSKGSLSLEQLREDELALDKKASLVDTETDIDYKQTFSLIWRCVVLIRFFWRRFVVVLSMEWIMAAVGTAVAP